MAEGLDMKVQVVDLGDRKVVDIEPPVDETREEALRESRFLREIPDAALVFVAREPDEGELFSEVDCAKVAEGLAGVGLEFDAVNFGREVGEILAEHGDNVTFLGEVAMDERGYGFLTLTPYTAPVEAA